MRLMVGWHLIFSVFFIETNMTTVTICKIQLIKSVFDTTLLIKNFENTDFSEN
jgi:hypothetical protein